MKIVELILDSCARCPFIRGNNPYFCQLVESSLGVLQPVLQNHQAFRDDCPLKSIRMAEITDLMVSLSQIKRGSK